MNYMKTILAFSDAHGVPLPERLVSVARESDFVFFLGDGLGGLREIACDSYPAPEERVLDIENVRVLLTHGHLYRVKTDLLNLTLRAEELGCSLAFFGHTHLAEEVKADGVTLVNPGSLAYPMTGTPSYAYTVINGDKIVTTLVKL